MDMFYGPNYNPKLTEALRPHDDHVGERIKLALQRDWDQTKHDFGGEEPDLHQGLGVTLAEMMGTEPVPPRGVPIQTK